MADTVKRTYGNFLGVDLRRGETDPARSPDSKNVWKDYRQGGNICTRPAMEQHSGWPGRIYGIFFFEDELLVHCADTLWRVKDGQRSVLYSGLREAAGEGFILDDRWYFKDGKHYLYYDKAAVREVAGYIPTTSTGRTPAGEGTAFEQANLLTGMRRNTFRGDGLSLEYQLDAENIDRDVQPEVTMNGGQITDFTVNYELGIISFANAPETPTAKADNVSVLFSKTDPGSRQRILNCAMARIFDDRVFFSGDPERPNVIWYCGRKQPDYCGEKDCWEDGVDRVPVREMVAGSGALWVIREPGGAGTNVFCHTPAAGGRGYSAECAYGAAGCVGRGIWFNGSVVFFSGCGMEQIGGINSRQLTVHKSSLADPGLTASPDYRNMLLTRWEGYLLVFLGKQVFLADSRTAPSLYDHTEYEWYYWEMEKEVTCVRVREGILYLGTEDGIYTLTDTEGPVRSWWTTPKDHFGWPDRWKSMGKRGFAVEAAGDMTLSVRTDQTEFAPVGTYENVRERFICRVRRKRFRELQLKIDSGTRFRLGSLSLECWAGGHIRR